MSASATQSPAFNTGSDVIHVSNEAIICIVVISVTGLAALAVSLYFLLRSTCSRKRRISGYAIRDGRNEHVQWWKYANPPLHVTDSLEKPHAEVVAVPAPVAGNDVRMNGLSGRGNGAIAGA